MIAVFWREITIGVLLAALAASGLYIRVLRAERSEAEMRSEINVEMAKSIAERAEAQTSVYKDNTRKLRDALKEQNASTQDELDRANKRAEIATREASRILRHAVRIEDDLRARLAAARASAAGESAAEACWRALGQISDALEWDASSQDGLVSHD